MKTNPEIIKDPDYKTAKIWMVAGIANFIIGIFLFPTLAAFALAIGFFVAMPKYLAARKRHPMKQ